MSFKKKFFLLFVMITAFSCLSKPKNNLNDFVTALKSRDINKVMEYVVDDIEIIDQFRGESLDTSTFAKDDISRYFKSFFENIDKILVSHQDFRIINEKDNIQITNDPTSDYDVFRFVFIIKDKKYILSKIIRNVQGL